MQRASLTGSASPMLLALLGLLALLALPALLSDGCGQQQQTTSYPCLAADAGAPSLPDPGPGAQVFAPGPGFPLADAGGTPWQAGYSATASLAADQFRPAAFTETVGAIQFWHPAAGAAGYYPYVAHHLNDAAGADASASWWLRAGEIAVEGSAAGQYGLVRFVAPQAGLYQIDAWFEGVHARLSSTDVHVLVDGSAIFDAAIDGYGGDPSFHAAEGACPRAMLSSRRNLAAGAVVTFAVGYGSNATNYNDTTGLIAQVSLLP